MTEKRDSTAQCEALAFESVTFGYHGEPVVEAVSLTISPGDMVGLLGPNGAGKSTLVRLASGVIRPSRGSVRIRGVDARELARDEVARRVAVVPQEFNVQFAYTVRQVVELGRTPHRGSWGFARTGDREAIEAALDATGTTALADRIFNELSGGERQRVLIALALSQSAGIVLLDEPTAHLDIKHQIEVLEMLRRLNRERDLTVVAVMHDLNLAARFFPRLILFKRRVIADGPPAPVLSADLLARVYETPVQVGILRGEEHLSVLPPGYAYSANGMAPVTDARAPSAMVHVLAGGGSGELLMRTLADTTIAFSAGPLNVGDSDYGLALRLAVVCFAEPPYAPVSSQGLEAASERMAAARAVVVCPAPLGPGNVLLLDAVMRALRAGTVVILLEPGSDVSSDSESETMDFNAVRERDFSGRGVTLYESLTRSGARLAASPLDAVRLLRQVLSDELSRRS